MNAIINGEPLYDGKYKISEICIGMNSDHEMVLQFKEYIPNDKGEGVALVDDNFVYEIKYHTLTIRDNQQVIAMCVDDSNIIILGTIQIVAHSIRHTIWNEDGSWTDGLIETKQRSM